MKQTAVEWLVDQLRQLALDQDHPLGLGGIRLTLGHLDELTQQAKAMEKEQMNEIHLDGIEQGYNMRYQQEKQKNN
jgi:hypothetical protein